MVANIWGGQSHDFAARLGSTETESLAEMDGHTQPHRHGLEEKLETTTAPHPSQEEGNSSQTFFFLLSVKVLLLGGQSLVLQCSQWPKLCLHFFSMQRQCAPCSTPWQPPRRH